MSESTQLLQHLDELHAIDKRYLEAIRQERRRICEDEHLDSVDRAVLGTLATEEALTRYRTLARFVGQQIGKPLIVVSEVKEGRVTRAGGGIIAGPMRGVVRDINFRHHGSREEDPPEYSATLVVPVNPIATYAWYQRPRGYRETEHNVYVNRDTTGSNTPGGDLDIVHFRSSIYNNRTSDPLQDVESTVQTAQVLVGREAIYRKGEWLANGLLHLLLAIEETRPASVSEATAEPAV